MRQNTTTKNKVTEALNRVVNQAVGNDGRTEAYLCSLRLPREFNEDPHEANQIYKKVQADFCKHVMRSTGSTPRYVAVKTENESNPEYAFCLFTKADAALDKPEEYAEKGREIANGKAGQAGWGKGKLDIVELFKDAPRFTIASQSIKVTELNRKDAILQLHQHLQSRQDIEALHQRTIFVSKCP